MANADQEIEVKFMVRNHAGLLERLTALGAQSVSPRVHETNLRFDDAQHRLTNARQALRLRQDVQTLLTFKGPAQPGEQASVRQEIEFQVSDFHAARRFLEALGYQVVVMYEKYRTTLLLGDVLVTLDEMPYGYFVELESGGSDWATATLRLHAAADALQLDWEARSNTSYLALFDQLRRARSISARHLTFDELRGVEAQPEDLGLRYADG